jgi:hypothetical protein
MSVHIGSIPVPPLESIDGSQVSCLAIDTDAV